MMFVIACATAIVCALAAALLGRWMRSLAESDSRWLRSGLHIVLAAAGGFGVAHLAMGLVDLAAFSVLVVACALLVPIDLAVYRLPDKLVLPLYPVLLVGLAVTAGMFDEWGSFGRAVAAGAILLALYFILALINPSGMGLGDVKLSGVLGAFLGWFGWPALMAGTLAAFVINAVAAVALLAARRVGAKSGIAFGPAMVLGAAAGVAYFVVRSGGVALLGAA